MSFLERAGFAGGVPLRTKIFYGVGSVAYGVKDNGLLFFLLLYYNQVLGLPAGLVGLILLTALFLDGLSDPVAGYISDHWHSRWGRRHPFMYASALPVALAYYFLWNPPAGLETGTLFLYGLLLTVLVRLLITLYETPSTALVAEMTEDYRERTFMLSLRYFFGWFAGITMAVIAYLFLLQPSVDYPIGQLNPRGYEVFGLIGACVIFCAIIASSLGTHSSIPFLKSPPPKKPFRFSETWREVMETLGSRSFFALLFAALFFAMGAGITTGLYIYFMTYFWELSSTEIGYFTVMQYGSAILALGLTPPIAGWLGKRRAAVAIGSLAFLLSPLPIVLRLMEWFPGNDSAALLPSLLLFSLIDVALIISASITITSMIADLVEESEAKTGRRAEGLFFAARTFIRKAVAGFGAFVSSLVLAFVGFPEDAQPGEVGQDVLFNFGLVYSPLLFLVYLAGIICLSRYTIDEEKHKQNVEEAVRLRGRAQPA